MLKSAIWGTLMLKRFCRPLLSLQKTLKSQQKCIGSLNLSPPPPLKTISVCTDSAHTDSTLTTGTEWDRGWQWQLRSSLVAESHTEFAAACYWWRRRSLGGPSGWKPYRTHHHWQWGGRKLGRPAAGCCMALLLPLLIDMWSLARPWSWELHRAHCLCHCGQWRREGEPW